MSHNVNWTIETYAAHNEALRQAEEKFHSAEEKFQSERDRRYAEVKGAEEKALRVKDEADKNALLLAREIQTYKDEKANELRQQIESERGIYIKRDEYYIAHNSLTEKLETMIKPLSDFVALQQGRQTGISATWAVVVTLLGLLGGGGLIGWIMFLINR